MIFPVPSVDIHACCFPRETRCLENELNITKGITPLLLSQFGKPTGFWGSVAGMIMAHRFANQERARWAVELLKLQPGDRVLEIGFGPGLAIDRMVRTEPLVHVVGIDHSEVMMRQAARRNARATKDGRVDLRLASVEDLPAFECPFDKIFSINSIGRWNDPVVCLESLRSVLVPSGTLGLMIQPSGPGAGEGTIPRATERLTELLDRAGFRHIRHVLKSMRPVSSLAVMGLA